MEGRTILLRNGVELPRVGLGTFRMASADVAGAIHAALQQGIRHIDTASIYRNQEAIGQALKSAAVPRQEEGMTMHVNLLLTQMFITSKVSPYEQGTAKAHAACQDILAKLDTEYVDLVLIHWPGASKTQPQSERNARLRLETWRVLEQFHQQGKFRAIGVSNFEEEHLSELMREAAVPPAVNQFEVHPRRPATALREACRQAGVAVVAYASLGAGDLLTHPLVQSVAAKSGKTPAQVLLRWGLEQGCAVIPKSVQPQRIAQFAEQQLLGGWTQQQLAAVKELDTLQDQHKYCWNPQGIR